MRVFLCVLERGSATRRAVEEGLAAAGIRPRIAMELGSSAAVIGAAGAGIGVVPARMLGMQTSLKRLDLGGLEFRRPFALVVERGRLLSPAAEAFTTICSRKVYA